MITNLKLTNMKKVLLILSLALFLSAGYVAATKVQNVNVISSEILVNADESSSLFDEDKDKDKKATVKKACCDKGAKASCDKGSAKASVDKGAKADACCDKDKGAKASCDKGAKADACCDKSKAKATSLEGDK
jgi:hypothetical protein